MRRVGVLLFELVLVGDAKLVVVEHDIEGTGPGFGTDIQVDEQVILAFDPLDASERYVRVIDGHVILRRAVAVDHYLQFFVLEPCPPERRLDPIDGPCNCRRRE